MHAKSLQLYLTLFCLFGGYLLYNLVVVSAIHWHESAMGVCVPHPEPPLPPPSPSHPSGLSQCTGFECPVSCIKPRLVIYFTYGNHIIHIIHISHMVIHMFQCWRGCGEKGALLHCWWECNLVQPLWRTGWRFLSNLETELPYDPAIPLLGTHTQETRIKRHVCPSVSSLHCLQWPGHGSDLDARRMYPTLQPHGL